MERPEYEVLKCEMDGWIKDIHRELTSYRSLPELVEEHEQNIDHNYELLQEMRAEITKLKEELSALRFIQLMHLEAEVGRIKKTK